MSTKYTWKKRHSKLWILVRTSKEQSYCQPVSDMESVRIIKQTRSNPNINQVVNNMYKIVSEQIKRYFKSTGEVNLKNMHNIELCIFIIFQVCNCLYHSLFNFQEFLQCLLSVRRVLRSFSHSFILLVSYSVIPYVLAEWLELNTSSS